MSDTEGDKILRVDTSEFAQLIEQLDDKSVRNAARAGLRKSAATIKRGVQTSYRGAFPGSGKYKGVHMAAFRSGKGAIIDLKYIRVKGAGNSRDKNASAASRYWVLRILNQGTAPRMAYTRGKVTKNGLTNLNRGAMRPNDFFQRGVEATKPRAVQELTQNIENAITKRAAKKGIL